MPGSMKAFDQIRPGDQNLEIGVSSEEKVLTFYMFNDPALNTFSKEEADKKNGLNNFKIINEANIPTRKLSTILKENLKGEKTIDYLNIDAEGLDMEVLRSNDWNLYAPEVISVECGKDIRVHDTDVYKYLSKLGYDLVSVMFNTLIFAKNGTGTRSVICI
jgi:RNA-binding protein YhbY